MFALELGFRIVEQPDGAAGDLPVAIRAGHQEIDLHRPLDLPDQVAQEDEAPLEEAQDQQFPVGVGGGDLGPEFGHAGADLVLVEHHRLHRRPPVPRRATSRGS